MEKPLLFSVRISLALVLLTPLIVMSPPLPFGFFPYVVGKALYAHTLIEIALGMWIVLALRHPSYRIPHSRLLLIFGIYILIAFMAAIFGVSPQRSLWSNYERMTGVVSLTHWFLYMVILVSVFRSWADWRVLFKINLGVGFVVCLLGVSQHFDIWLLGFMQETNRLDITLGNATYVGTYMLVNVLIGFALLGYSLSKPTETVVNGVVSSQTRKNRKKRIQRNRESSSEIRTLIETAKLGFLALAIILHLWILFLSASRGALIGLLAGLLAFSIGYIMWGKDGRIKFISATIFSSVIFLVLVIGIGYNTTVFSKIASSNTMLHRISEVGSQDNSLKGRINSGKLGLIGFVHRPILGWGPENFSVAYDRHLTTDVVADSSTTFDQAHNKLIEELTTKGILGFSAYLAIWIYALYVVRLRVREQSKEHQVVTLWLGAAFVGYFIQNLFLFDSPGTMGQFFLLLGYIVYLEATSVPKIASTSTTTKTSRLGTAHGSKQYLRSDISTVMLIGVIGVIVGVLIYLINYSPYKASQKILYTYISSIGWDRRMGLFDEAFQTFPPLANYPRVMMFKRLVNEWDELTIPQTEAALNIAAREGYKAIKNQPEEWRVYTSLGAIYQNATTIDPDYVWQARALIDKAVELAPARIEVQRSLIIQYIIEEDLDSAQYTINSYLEKNPKAVSRLDYLQKEIDRITGQ